MGPLAKFILCILLVCAFTGCTDSKLTLSASNRWQITEALVLDAELSEDGLISALILAGNRIEVWHNASRSKLAEWHSDIILPDSRLLVMSDDGQYLLSANPKGLQIWHQKEKQPFGHLDLSQHLGDARITQMAFWVPPYQFVLGTSAGDVIFADTKNNAYRMNRYHSGEVVKLNVDKNKRTLFSGGNDGLLVKWDLLNYQALASKQLPHRITSLAIGNNDNIFVSDALKTHWVWDSQSESVIGELGYWQQFQWFRQAIFVLSDKFLITTSPKTELFLWDLSDYSMKSSWVAESQSLGSMISDIALLHDMQLRSLSSDAVVQDWQLNNLLE